MKIKDCYNCRYGHGFAEDPQECLGCTHYSHWASKVPELISRIIAIATIIGITIGLIVYVLGGV